MSQLLLRDATFDDAERLWVWANDPDTRESSFHTGFIPWSEHAAWLKRKLQDPACELWLACDPDGTPFAEIRFDLDGATAVISITVAPQQRGQGLGTVALQGATERLFESTDTSQIVGYVKPDNQASMRAFLKAGFQDQGDTSVNGIQAKCLVMERPREQDTGS
ncbi:MAG: GNAT family N-acetyltransferase [Candidatus Hydrogenedentes bacterium]|nr:GNAT family N-acetyltransferase [Candidatus Hydrogenedentota bacterium]